MIPAIIAGAILLLAQASASALQRRAHRRDRYAMHDGTVKHRKLARQSAALRCRSPCLPPDFL